ncbi:M48 family metallopeptidase [Thiorhodococcus mannitoliphagus]|uniref:M48 family metallopeptidase n=1 Tax=Thiorhodococcus mannitoliphagus TaxID=329406 RepID=A0A6P1DP51_9GAMM|nr:SprT family zinc-dependent metalloprotease [Thiorhodococcus mannitoliphagus]NEX19768.1 M48 family metallopeptidase [Thiorhodococcus mannitoliphagus]
MTIEAHHLDVAGIRVEVVRKDIKNLHLGVYPPVGRVRVAAPLVLTDEAVRLAIIDKLGWIKRQQLRFAEQPRQSVREMVSGETHYVFGQPCRLQIHIQNEPPKVMLRGNDWLDLCVRPDTDARRRESILLDWYRERLRERIPPLLDRWQAALGVEASEWRIKKMKTRWGSCSIAVRRIWLNLELAKKPPQCLEYILVHELAHLLERHHNERFIALLDAHLPSWRQSRDILNQMPLGHEEWNE